MSNSQNQNQSSQNLSKDLAISVPRETDSTTQLSDEHTAALISMAQDLVAAQTTKPDFKTKLKSRKFWLSAAGCIAGVMGMIGCSDNAIAVAIFAVLEILSIAVYCISEGKIDAKRTEQLIDAATMLMEIIGGKRDPKEEADKVIKDNHDHIAEPLAYGPEADDNDA